MQKLYHFFSSMKLTVILFAIFAIASAVATFVENDFGVAGSWSLVYGARWFEVVIGLLGLSLILNIYKYKLYSPRKLHVGIFHISIIFMIIGMIVTRYVGYEGLMHVREGDTSNTILSSETFIKLQAEQGAKKVKADTRVLLSGLGLNDFSLDSELDGKEIEVEYRAFIPKAIKKIAEVKSGKPIVSMFVTNKASGTEQFVLAEGDQKTVGGMRFAFDEEADVQFYVKEDKLYLKTDNPLHTYRMSDQRNKDYEAGSDIPLEEKQLYTVGTTTFAFKKSAISGKMKYMAASEKELAMGAMAYSAVIVELEVDDHKRELTLLGTGKNSVGVPARTTLGGVDITLSWGAKELKLPFAIKLDDFVLKRYPGSMSPSSYESYVTLLDEQNGVSIPFHIYMNHVLDYQGYRFFQSSYDQDERGSVLSVNNDPGKLPTYIGYLLLAIGFIYNLLSPKSRFRSLVKKLASVALLLLLTHSSSLYAEEIEIDKEVAQAFSTILVQSRDGRIKPIDTLSHDILNKVHRSGYLKSHKLDANQVILGMMSDPKKWQSVKIIKVKHSKLKKILGLADNEKYAAFNDFFDESGYKLRTVSEVSNRKRPIERNQFDKAIMKVNEKVDIIYQVYQGSFFTMFPSDNDKWLSPKTAIESFVGGESEEIRKMLLGLFNGVGTKDHKLALGAIYKIKEFQSKRGAAIIPDQSKIDLEVVLNHSGVFAKLTPVYLLSGLLLLGGIFARMLKPQLKLTTYNRIFWWVLFAAFLAFTAGLILRWYVSGHAPWSNAYESMLYIAWSMSLAGLYFSRYNILAPALTGILAGISLFVAHLSFMDPQITNLVPVLKSYWLNIHVSIITASYGFLGLSAMLGGFTLILFMIKNDKNEQRIAKEITSATAMNEMSVILGLFMLTIGNFLGGVWANESWGRYWGWDPKETWALISILVYMIAAHLRFIPSMSSKYTYAVYTALAYASIIMTYFGVNFYLSGMHSYAAGDPLPIPSFIYYTLATIAFLIIMAYPKRDGKKAA
jgi:cytochrome c-type biogenesis protein CcsB